jgi:anti-sigma regulatory factor (Ser/Thr protein kinase)
MIANKVKLVLPYETSYLSLAQAFIRETAVIYGFQDKELMEMGIALEETMVNVITHGQRFEENETLEISCERVSSGIKIVVHETGIPFDPSQITSYKPSESLEEMSTKGLGTYLIRQMMDEVRFENLGPGGKETILIKHLPDSSPGDAEMSRRLQNLLEPEVIQEKIPYEIRGLDPPEAIEISRCAYKSHGYSFFDDHIYYPERLVHLNETGEMVSAVAVTQNNVFMGHAALLYQYAEDRIAELTFVFVNVEYRGQGAFNRLIEYLFACPKKRELRGIYAYAVANHVFTQKAMVRYAINDCGLLLATSPSSWKFKGIPGDSSQRISVVLSFKYMDIPQSKDLFPPEHHREIVEKLYRNLGAKEHRYLAVPDVSFEAEQSSVMETGCNESESCAEIFVQKFGPEIVREVHRLLRRFCVQQIACINLFLNLEDPGTYSFTSEFEKLGFFFAGILPCARIGDTLILQYLNNVGLDYSKMHLYSDMAKEIHAYIQARDPNAAI